MSLFRQLLLAIALSTLLAFLGTAAISLLSSRHYLEQQLQLKNEDNASALALLMTQQKKDPVSMELYVTSLFDNGHYELIEVRDPKNAVVVQRTAPEDNGDVPVWFTRLLPINPTPGQAQISDGWRQFGTITLRSQSRFAYKELWRGASEMAGWLLLGGIISGWMGSMVLNRLRRPLEKVVDQARAICDRRFATIDEPRVPELKQLAIAMNTMVGRLKSMFDEEAARLEAVRREANYDLASGAPNRTFFFSQMSDLLKSEDHAQTGSIILVRIIDLGTLNRVLGRIDADRFLKNFFKTLQENAKPYADHLIGRLNGSDFAIALPGLDDAEMVSSTILQQLDEISAHFSEGKPVVRIGFGVYEQGMEPGPILGMVDSALPEAEASGDNKPRRAQISGNPQRPGSAGQWAEQLGSAIENGWLRLVGLPVIGFGATKLLHQETPLRMRFAEDGEWMTAGHFLPMATRLQKTAELDLAATRLALVQLAAQPDGPDLAVNLSGDSIYSESFRGQMRKLLKEHASLCSRLWLEVSEASAFAHLDAFRLFRQDLMDSECRIGIEHFGREFSRIGVLHDLGLHYLKVDGSFINDIDTQSGNQAFLEGLCQIAHNIGLLVIAEGVKRPEELALLPQLGFDGATGPAIPRD
ncbi:phytochrome-like protein cph2 [mine drainage metagenome]|uniref:Phytochrome-like protein cph2 n=1 Tax=mine drainage metagenome TaxID=410659 RepID=A0A1J5QR41_9ZZZZ